MDVLLIILIVALVVVVPAVVIAYSSSRTRRRQLGDDSPSSPVTAPTTTLGDRLARTRQALGDAVRGLLGTGALDARDLDRMEESLIAADMGVEVASGAVDALRKARPDSHDQAVKVLHDALVGEFQAGSRHLAPLGDPSVIVVVGVNGSGKTTTIAKLTAQYQGLGAGVVLAAADTYRAAADEQLRVWADRLGVDLVAGQQGADPASVAFDGLAKARAAGADVLIVDTAGRLHSDRNLMDELGKIVRVLEREAGSVDEVLLVIDGTAGQNAIAQAETFATAVGVTGIVITKLDGTAKGGVTIAIERSLGIPVKLIGVGESPEDLVPFEPDAFVAAVLGEDVA